MKNILLIPSLALLAFGCDLKPIEPQYMLPKEQAYSMMAKNPYMHGRISKVSATSNLENENDRMFFSRFSEALDSALGSAGLKGNKKPNYALDAQLLDTDVSSCLFGTCEGGSAIAYTLKNETGKTVYSDTVVVPYNHEYQMFDERAAQSAGLNTMTGAVGENIAHLIQVLSRKTKGEVQ